MENSQTTTPHTTSVVPQPTTLEGHPNNLQLADDHHRSSSGGGGGSSSSSGGGRTFLKSTATSSSSPNISNTPTTRRTRHRVDAGEPRGCFNNYYSPRNIFQQQQQAQQQQQQQHHNSSSATSPITSSLSQIVGNSAPDYYFQPMKMLSDWIGSNPHSHLNSHNNNNNNSTTNNNNTTAASQLLLREMLQKKKSGYEDGVVSEVDRDLPNSDGESLGACPSGVNNNNNNNITHNNNNEEIKINGCKKRKLYQPQRSDFDDDPEEFKDVEDDVDMDYKNSNSADEDEEMLKSPMAPLTRQLLTGDRKQIPRSILQSWKENFKSTLMTHINELVESQFNVLIGTIGHANNNNSVQNSSSGGIISHNNTNSHHHHGPPSRQQSITPPPLPNSVPPSQGLGHETALLTKNHFNGGGSILLHDNDKLRMRFYRPPYSSALAGLAASNNRDVFEDDGPLSLVVTPKKKRHKVTDTRLTPRAVSRLLGNGSTPSDHYMESTPSPRPQLPSPPTSVPISLPTSVAIPNPSLTESRHLFAPYAPLFNTVRNSLESPPTMLPHPMINPADYVQQLREISAREIQQAQRDLQREPVHQATILERERGGSAGSADSGDTTGGSFEITPGVMYGTGHSSSTLTPMHLRKAKLMFFWVRYPSSAVLKMYFPDIKFNKNNTAQLVKWFSNFREFYYIQMEKYARQALSEGIKVAEDIHVSTENELYRVLNLHYNRNNHIEVPSNFRYVVEQTLREFFKAIQSGKDAEQSWKKAIYKIIARLDDPVPEYFKSPNFLEQLE